MGIQIYGHLLDAEEAEALRGKIPIKTHGTASYIGVLLETFDESCAVFLDELPEVPLAVRERIGKEVEEVSLLLRKELTAKYWLVM